jgi:general secretion pathway protein I
LIEALVALAIVASALAAIGALIGTTVRGSRSIERHLLELETARSIISALPDREELVPGSSTGEIGGYRWRLDVSRLASPPTVRQPTWEPLAVVVTVEPPSGGALQVSTVRLHQAGH